jgi:hypothetical protein
MRHRMEGIIAAAGFASGDRVVVGHWASGPLGPMSDVMWAAPDGTRSLFAPTEAVATFITAVYDFDAVVVGPLHVQGDARGLDAAIGGPATGGSDADRDRAGIVGPATGGSDADRDRAGRRILSLRSGPGWRIPPSRRPAALTRFVEAPIARALMGVRTYGVSPSGVREWYQATEWRPLAFASASIEGRDLGPLRPIEPPCGFGFSEPPRRPSLTVVRPLLEDPSGRLDVVLEGVAPHPLPDRSVRPGDADLGPRTDRTGGPPGRAVTGPGGDGAP